MLPKKFRIGALIGLIGLGIAFMAFYSQDGITGAQASLHNIELQKEEAQKDLAKDLMFGFDKAIYHVDSGVIKKGQFLSEILLKYNVQYGTIDKLADNVRSIYDVRKIRAGKPYYILSKDTSVSADYFVYVPNDFKYILYSLKGDPCAKVIYNDVTIKERVVEGEITSSLWAAMEAAGAPYSLINKMEDAYAWTVDFYHLKDGDTYKLWYEEKLIDGEVVGVGQLKAGIMVHGGKKLYAIYFDEGTSPGYYNLEGRPMRKAFLKSPVKYGYISSPFNRNRFHPILHVRRPHLGTDYAAPYGTPIRSTAAGVVIAASYTSGNGNYIKVKHDDTYTTQYLHMSKFAEGIHVGTFVEQGQTIGYVGATGLATGPHVCYRFWKNGRQVNPLKQDLPEPEPMDSTCLQKYLVFKDSILQEFQDLVSVMDTEGLKKITVDKKSS